MDQVEIWLVNQYTLQENQDPNAPNQQRKHLKDSALRKPIDYIYDFQSTMAFEWEVLSKFFSFHNIEPNWLDCNGTYGWYDEDLGGWTGCIGKV